MIAARARRFFVGGLVALSAVGCELEEITVVDVENVVIAEVYVDLAADPTESIARAFLHRTVGLTEEVDNLLTTEVTITRTDGYSFRLIPEYYADCLESSPQAEPGACFVAEAPVAALRPGDILELRIDLVGGGVITGAARLPGDFDLVDMPESCRLPPDALLPVSWSRSERAWAYVNETSVRNLPDALRSEGIILEEDPLYLLGLSISDDDTSIVFPSEFGVFNRFDLDRDVAVRLQRGLPDDSWAEVTITAVDRNYVNWARGGNFNPSGQVRVPSLSGDGTGVFGATVGRRFNVFVNTDVGGGLDTCPVS